MEFNLGWATGPGPLVQEEKNIPVRDFGLFEDMKFYTNQVLEDLGAPGSSYQLLDSQAAR